MVIPNHSKKLEVVKKTQYVKGKHPNFFCIFTFWLVLPIYTPWIFTFDVQLPLFTPGKLSQLKASFIIQLYVKKYKLKFERKEKPCNSSYLFMKALNVASYPTEEKALGPHSLEIPQEKDKHSLT